MLRFQKRIRSTFSSAVRSSSSSHYPVCIVGGGPVGLLTSILLSQYKVPHCLVERRKLPTEHPQAHFINARTNEILQGHLSPKYYSKIQEQMPPSRYWRDFSYCYSVLGREYSRARHFEDLSHVYDENENSSIGNEKGDQRKHSQKSQDNEGEFKHWLNSPANIVHLPQSNLERILREAVEENTVANDTGEGAENEECCTFFGYKTLPQGISGGSKGPISVKIQPSHVNGSTTAVTTLTCDYLVASDGASSSTRTSLGALNLERGGEGVTMEGDSQMATLINVHFTCSGLKERLLQKDKDQGGGKDKDKGSGAMLYFVFNEELVCVLVAHDPSKDEYVCQIPIFPPFQSLQDFPESKLHTLLHAALCQGQSPSPLARDDIKILSKNTWSMHAEVASQFSLLDNHAFLVGDSAHRFPPSGGFGMNTGLQDAHNLAWRLACAHHGRGSSSSCDLSLYSSERREVARSNTQLSLTNYRKSERAARLLGVDPNLANLAVRAAEASAGFLPLSARKFAINTALTAGLAPLRALRGSGEETFGRVALLKGMVQRGESLPLLFPSHDIDFQYNPAGPVPGHNDEIRIGRGRGATLRVGGRIPHVWLQELELNNSNNSNSNNSNRSAVGGSAEEEKEKSGNGEREREGEGEIREGRGRGRVVSSVHLANGGLGSLEEVERAAGCPAYVLLGTEHMLRRLRPSLEGVEEVAVVELVGSVSHVSLQSEHHSDSSESNSESNSNGDEDDGRLSHVTLQKEHQRPIYRPTGLPDLLSTTLDVQEPFGEREGEGEGEGRQGGNRDIRTFVDLSGDIFDALEQDGRRGLAVLIRPDGHVAAFIAPRSEDTQEEEKELLRGFGQVLKDLEGG